MPAPLFDPSFWIKLWSTLFSDNAATIILLAGLAEGFGTQGVALLVNRATPRRFIVGIVVSAALYLVSALLWMGAIWVAGVYVFGAAVPFNQVVAAVSSAYIPLLFSTLALLPLIGPGIDALLRVLSLIIAVSSITAVFAFAWWEALLCAAIGTLLLSLVRLLLHQPTTQLNHWLWTSISGRGEWRAVGELPLVIPRYAVSVGYDEPRRHGEGEDAIRPAADRP